jgi:uncharacterized protein (TIGR02145 family)
MRAIIISNLFITLLYISCGHIGSKDRNYETKKIGTQEWMVENLNASKFQNGDTIFKAKSKEDWVDATIFKRIPAYCFYDFKESNDSFGLIYNRYVINSSQNICPDGYRLPKTEDFDILANYLGGWDAAVGKLKSNTGLWEDNSLNTNESGFSALAVGYVYLQNINTDTIRESRSVQLKDYDVVFAGLGKNIHFWLDDYNSYLKLKNKNSLGKFWNGESLGCYIRCIKGENDVDSVSEKTPSTRVIIKEIIDTSEIK